MRLGIMQPYFLPYIGYFQLISAVDLFILYDNIKYTKKGWINRNRMLLNDKDALFSLPLKKDSDYLDVINRELASSFDRTKLLGQFIGAYSRAPYFAQTYPLLERIVNFENTNLFRYNHNSIVILCQHLGIDTEIRFSSDTAIDHSLKSQEKVLSICQAYDADTYINAIGGSELYDRKDFNYRGINLKFLKSKPYDYPQFGSSFVPWLSIIDLLMFNSQASIRNDILPAYELLEYI